MSDQDAFERILASLYEAMLDDTLWPATSALIDEACGSIGNSLLVRAGPQVDSSGDFVGLCYRRERREDWERKYFTVYYPTAEHVPRFCVLPLRRVVPLAALYTAEELRTSPTYNEGFREGGLQDGVIVRLDGADGSDISWSLCDPVTPGGWGAGPLALFTRLLPHIQQFVRVRQALARAEALGASSTELLDNTRVGVIHLDQQGRILEANDRAHHILRRGDGLSDRGGELRAHVPADQARLGRLVAAALPTSTAPAVGGLMTLRRAPGMRPFVVHVQPLAVRLPYYWAPRTAALVLITEPGYPPRLDPTVVAAALGLTPTESQVAIWIAQGKTVAEIAATLGRTPSAVHWHLRHIYQKHGISRHADLVRLVLSLAALA